MYQGIRNVSLSEIFAYILNELSHNPYFSIEQMTELVRAAIENESKLQDACLLEDQDFFIDDVSILGKTFAVIFTLKKSYMLAEMIELR